MKTTLLLAAVVVLLSPSAPVLAADAGVVLPAMVGPWQGEARLLSATQTLPVQLAIAADGNVTGTLGGASLRAGKFERNRGAIGRALNIKTDYIIVGQLDGSLVPDRKDPPPRAMIPLTWHDDHFTGTVHGVKSWFRITSPAVSARVTLRRAATAVLATPPLSSPRDAYRIEAVVVPAERRCEARLELRYHNNSSQPLTALRLRLDSNLSAKQSLEILRVEDSAGGAIAWSYQPLQFGAWHSDRGAIEIALASSLAPAADTTVVIAFRSTGNHLGPDMLGLQDDPFTSLDAWYPKAMSHTGNAWSIDDDRLADYDVSVELPAAMTVASSGRRASDTLRADDRRVLRLRADGLRGFTVYGSANWRRQEQRVGRVDLGICLPPEAEAWAGRLLAATADAIAFYEAEYVPFPSDHLDIACPGSLGDRGEGSSAACNLITLFLGRTLEQRDRLLTAHEVAHQYFGSAIGFPRDSVGWVPMGLGLMMDEHCARVRGFDGGMGRALMRDFYFRAEQMGFDTTLSQSVQGPLRSPAPWSFGWNMALAHGKAYAVCALLRDLLGPEKFQAAIKTLLRTHAGALIREADLIRACEAECGQRLDWFAADWIDGRATFDYAIRTVERVESGWDVTVARLGSGGFPALVEVTTTAGEKLRQRVDRTKAKDVLHFATAGQLESARLNPDGVYPDLNSANDAWPPATAQALRSH